MNTEAEMSEPKVLLEWTGEHGQPYRVVGPDTLGFYEGQQLFNPGPWKKWIPSNQHFTITQGLAASVAALTRQLADARRAVLTLYEMYQDDEPGGYEQSIRVTGLWGWVKGQVGAAADAGLSAFTVEEINAAAAVATGVSGSAVRRASERLAARASLLRPSSAERTVPMSSNPMTKTEPSAAAKKWAGRRNIGTKVNTATETPRDAAARGYDAGAAAEREAILREIESRMTEHAKAEDAEPFHELAALRHFIIAREAP